MGHTTSPIQGAGLKAVHPHIRGAYKHSAHRHCVLYGSSPHTWGILLASSLPILVHRFIPTYVGHTNDLFLSMVACSVHPHIRGAYLSCPSSRNMYTGSSPHTWGIRRTAPNTPLETGFIPTYVGHTVNRVLPGGVISGSSPHTWGILSPGDLHSQRGRFIPTYVGHTPGQGRGRRQPAVHPHIRGAYADH